MSENDFDNQQDLEMWQQYENELQQQEESL